LILPRLVHHAYSNHAEVNVPTPYDWEKVEKKFSTQHAIKVAARGSPVAVSNAPAQQPKSPPLTPKQAARKFGETCNVACRGIQCSSDGLHGQVLPATTRSPPHRIWPAIYLLLVSPDGKPVNKQVLDFVAEPIEITGEVERQGELLILRADPAAYGRAR
jgi:hypothetical protein